MPAPAGRARRTPTAPRRRDRAHLARPEVQPRRSGRRRPAPASTVAVAVPAELDARSPPAPAARATRCSPADVALVWTTRSQPPAAVPGGAKPHPERGRHRGTGRLDVDQRRPPCRGPAPGAGRRSSPTTPPPTTATRSPTSGAASRGVDARSPPSRPAPPAPPAPRRARRSPRKAGRRTPSGAGGGRRRCGPEQVGGPSSTTPTLR